MNLQMHARSFVDAGDEVHLNTRLLQEQLVLILWNQTQEKNQASCSQSGHNQLKVMRALAYCEVLPINRWRESVLGGRAWLSF